MNVRRPLAFGLHVLSRESPTPVMIRLQCGRTNSMHGILCCSRLSDLEGLYLLGCKLRGWLFLSAETVAVRGCFDRIG